MKSKIIGVFIIQFIYKIHYLGNYKYNLHLFGIGTKQNQHLKFSISIPLNGNDLMESKSR